jgi:hypothetical protein
MRHTDAMGEGERAPTYRLEDGPTHVPDAVDEALPGHYEAGFRAADGSVVQRYLTDKGRAWLLRRLDEGDAELSDEELQERTVEPDLDALIARMEHESGEGA